VNTHTAMVWIIRAPQRPICQGLYPQSSGIEKILVGGF
jgi:hypothetical protein